MPKQAKKDSGLKVLPKEMMSLTKVILTASAKNFYSLNNPGRIRLNADIRIDLELIDDFTIGFSNYHHFDNEPASAGASTYGWGINTTIGYTF